jgi:mono/diheme cytochrome c family protein
MLDGFYKFLASIGFNEPIHPPITHMPIGLIVGALVFFLIAVIFKRKHFELSARHSAILAFVFAFPTILFGVMDWIHFYHAALITPIIIKITLASIVIVVLALVIIFGNEIKFRNVFVTSVYAIAFVCVIGLGYFGAGLIYGRGVAAQAKESQEPLSKEATAGEQVFVASCMSCHADGGNVVAENEPLKTSKMIGNIADFTAFIRDPRMPDGKVGAMPAFSVQDLREDQAKDLFEYIKVMVASKWK